MFKTIDEFINKWNNIERMPIFEFQVKKDNELKYLIFDIRVMKNEKGIHELTANNGGFASVEIDLDFSLDENLQVLYDKVLDILFFEEYEIIE